MMKQKRLALYWGLILLFISSATDAQAQQNSLATAAFIPKPVSVIADSSSFLITEETVIFVPDNSKAVVQVGDYLSAQLKNATGFEIPMTQVTPTPDNAIHLTLTTDTELGGEGYQLTISAIQLQLTANSPQGLFRGVQTICQLLPVKAVSRNPQQAISIPGGTIRDYSKYNYRGFMLDVSRHFFGLEDVKHCIDLLALFKMNVLHLHLSDDQGWRIEIKSWPKLTTVGGSTDIDGGKGGFYTQEQYAELVEYAQSRYITIIPWIAD